MHLGSHLRRTCSFPPTSPPPGPPSWSPALGPSPHPRPSCKPPVALPVWTSPCLPLMIQRWQHPRLLPPEPCLCGSPRTSVEKPEKCQGSGRCKTKNKTPHGKSGGCGVASSLPVGPASSLLPQPLRARPPTPTQGALACPPSSWVWALWPVLQGKPGMGMWWRLSEVHTSKVKRDFSRRSRQQTDSVQGRTKATSSGQPEGTGTAGQTPGTTDHHGRAFFFKLCFI